MWRKILLIFFVAVLVFGIAARRFPVVFWRNGGENIVKSGSIISQEPKAIEDSQFEEKVAVESEKPVPDGETLIEKVLESSLIENVPFTVQAPFGEWNISTFQNGCEEASVVMATYWILGKPLTKEIAKKEIIALAKFEDKKHSQSIDTSAKDTEKFFKEYYNITTTEIRTDIKVADIQETLASGALVIVPANGIKLKNPNYKQPGPMTHMLVVIGYDAEKKEFITNDSGTKNGKGYRYKGDILYEAIRDYPTGDHLPIQGIHKDMIVVRKP